MLTDLSQYNNDWYDTGAGKLKRLLWYMTNVLFFINPLNPISAIKVLLLRLFGAKIGKGVVIKPSVNIKYPWLLSVGNFSWIGEHVWIDNLGKTVIGKNCCISQGALLLCGNHDYTSPTFDLMVKPITLEDGVWIGAKSIVTPGTLCEDHSVLTANSMASGKLESMGIYQGTPARKIKTRKIETAPINQVL